MSEVDRPHIVVEYGLLGEWPTGGEDFSNCHGDRALRDYRVDFWRKSGLTVTPVQRRIVFEEWVCE